MSAGGPRRWREQRWLVDETIRTQTIEFDQPRIGYTLGPVSSDSTVGEMVALRTRIRKVADFVPVVTSLARRREALARAAESAGREVTAGEHWFAAALLWSLACWPLWRISEELEELDDRKNAAYLSWAALASHRVERVDIPFRDATLPAWFHLPPGYSGGPLPTVLACGGMDAPREVCVAREGDGLLARGFAVLAFDGPGQGESAVRGVNVTPTAWVDAGAAIVEWARQRAEVDASRLVASGTSFGSHWITQIAATQPSLLGCAAALPIFEPGAATIFEQAAPTFKARHMFMAGLFDDEAAFDEMAAGYDLRPYVEGMTVPWLVVGGDADELSPSSWVFDLAARTPAPTSLLLYAGGRHSLTESQAALMGPSWRTEIADWLLDRVNGVDMVPVHRWVDPNGTVVERPHPRAGSRASAGGD